MEDDFEAMRAKFTALLRRQRTVMEQWNKHEKDDPEAWKLYAAEIDKITAEMGAVTGADQESDWPKP